jgi:catechol 2,3-dioxygenase-like lactoylglutathione lyase family enzyme
MTPLTDVGAVSLFVEDVQAAKAFYEDVFRVPVVFEDETSACLKFDRVLVNLVEAASALELVEPGTVAGPDTGSRFQLSIFVDDVDEVCADLQSRGVEILAGPIDRPWAMRTAIFTDPAGHSWEVAQPLSG